MRPEAVHGHSGGEGIARVHQPFRERDPQNPLPTLRDPDLLIYFREEGGGLIMGGYERPAFPAFLPDRAGFERIPPDFNGRLLEDDWDRFEEIVANSRRRVPQERCRPRRRRWSLSDAVRKRFGETAELVAQQQDRRTAATQVRLRHLRQPVVEGGLAPGVAPGDSRLRGGRLQ